MPPLQLEVEEISKIIEIEGVLLLDRLPSTLHGRATQTVIVDAEPKKSAVEYGVSLRMHLLRAEQTAEEPAKTQGSRRPYRLRLVTLND